MPHPDLRFTLWSLFLILAIFAGLFAGYRFGHHSGYAAGEKDWGYDHMFSFVYYVGDLIAKPGESKSDIRLDNLITQNVDPISWEPKQRARIGPDAIENLNNQITIQQSARNHEIIRALLESLRNLHIKFAPRYVPRYPAPDAPPPTTDN